MRDRAFHVARAALVGSLLLVSACVSSTPSGKCVGVNGREDPALIYQYSARNIFWGIAGIEVIYPPIKVALDELKCPTGRVGGGAR